MEFDELVIYFCGIFIWSWNCGKFQEMAATAESQPQEGEPMDVGQQEQLPLFSTINILQVYFLLS